MKKVVCFHLYNDFSGSPKVLKSILQELLEHGYKIDLLTSNTEGTLCELKNKKNFSLFFYSYKFSTNVIVEILRYSYTQLYSFLWALKYIFSKETVFYINTLLPVGPALAGRIIGKKVIYHYHENASSKSIIYKILCWMMERLASDIICVSRYQSSLLSRTKNIIVIPNALITDFIERIRPNMECAFYRKKILMLASLKLYKGIIEFVYLAEFLPYFKFDLVINATQDNITKFLLEKSIQIPLNLTIYPRQNDVIPFYNNASLVLNLSNKKYFVETFGLTALEAMTAGLPVIVPTIGGIAELVEDGINGYKIDVQNLNRIADTIRLMLSNKELYNNLSKAALESSKKYSINHQMESIIKIIEDNIQ